MSWYPSRPPRQRGRVFVITGGNTGLGYFAAEQIARAGGHVILASRTPAKAEAAAASIRGHVPGARVDVRLVDLASLESARRLGDALAALPRLDGIVLNAGITAGGRERRTTEDGLELTVGTNFVGHFALLAHAWPAVVRTPGARVVGLGSLSTLLVRLDPDDLMSERRYSFSRAYGLSKHAVHGFVFELDRRMRAVGIDAAALLAHPGLALDGLSARRPGVVRPGSPAELLLAAVAQGKNRGAAPVVRALLDPRAHGGEFYGPAGGLTGRPVLVRPVASSASPAFGRDLWARAEAWAGESFLV